MNLDDELVQRKAQLLLDYVSQRRYITKYMAEKLQLREIGKNLLVIYTFGTNKPENIETPVVEIEIRLNSGVTMHMKANVVPNITGKIQRVPVKDEIKEKLQKYELADIIPTAIESTYVDLLVGNDYYGDIISLQIINITEGLYLLLSKLYYLELHTRH